MNSQLTHINQLFHLALTARNAGDRAQAGTLLQKIISDAPGFAPAYTELGILYAEAGNTDQAEAYLKKAVDLAPQAINCLHTLAHFYRTRSNWQYALQYFEASAKLAPNNLPVLADLLDAQRILKKFSAALNTAERILRLQPNDLKTGVVRGEILDSMGRLHESCEQFKALLNRPDLPLFVVQRWADIMIRLERTDELLRFLDARDRAQPAALDFLLMISAAHAAKADYTNALNTLEKASRLAPDDVRVLHDMGVTLRFLGRIEESKLQVERLLKQNPFHAEALRLLGDDHHYQSGDPAFNRLMQAKDRFAEYPPADQVHLGYALGKAFDDIGDYAAAFDYYTRAGHTYLQQYPLDEDRSDGYIELVRHVFVEEKPYAQKSGYRSDTPVFVLGMPRSGTSLVEQILSSHPDVYGVGESKYLMRALDGIHLGKSVFALNSDLPFFESGQLVDHRRRGEKYLEALSLSAPSNAKRIVDKMPGNYAWAGFIKLILPDAKIIHCRRHPVETSLSAFRIFFNEGNSFSSDLAQMGRIYRRYEELMAIWRSAIPAGDLMEISYETLVLDFENQARRLIEFIGLEWDEKCLDFHRTDRVVRTASSLQVRKPLYKTALDRWRKYEAYLKPLLDELGPLVEQYEEELNAANKSQER